MVSATTVLNLSNRRSYLLIIACQRLSCYVSFLLRNIQQHFHSCSPGHFIANSPVSLFCCSIATGRLGAALSLTYFPSSSRPRNCQPWVRTSLLQLHSHTENQNHLSPGGLPVTCQGLWSQNHLLITCFFCLGVLTSSRKWDARRCWHVNIPVWFSLSFTLFRAVVLNQGRHFPHQGHWALSEDMFGCHSWGGGGYYWDLVDRGQEAAIHSTVPKGREDSGPNFSRLKSPV